MIVSPPHTIDILSGVFCDCGDHPVWRRRFTSTLDVCPQGDSSRPSPQWCPANMSPAVSKCPLRSTISPEGSTTGQENREQSCDCLTPDLLSHLQVAIIAATAVLQPLLES